MERPKVKTAAREEFVDLLDEVVHKLIPPTIYIIVGIAIGYFWAMKAYRTGIFE